MFIFVLFTSQFNYKVRNRHYLSKNNRGHFLGNFWKNWATFIPTSGHSVVEERKRGRKRINSNKTVATMKANLRG